MSIYLVGFMGCGKTTIGQALSQSLKRPWKDLDQAIEKAAGQTIPEIFSEKGEGYFRSLETIALKATLQEEGIISTGGGVITTPENIELLQKECTIYLEYPFETLYERIVGDSNRPLATSYEALYERFHQRLDLYQKASQVRINCQGKSINQITQEIITYLETIS